jgi:hypothetical protein
LQLRKKRKKENSIVFVKCFQSETLADREQKERGNAEIRNADACKGSRTQGKSLENSEVREGYQKGECFPWHIGLQSCFFLSDAPVDWSIDGEQEEDKLATDGKKMAESADEALAEMDAGLEKFRAKMKAKKEESEASLRKQDAEFESMSRSPCAADNAPDACLLPTLPMQDESMSHLPSAPADAAPLTTDKTKSKTDSPEPDVSAGSRFKMSLFSRVRPKKQQLEEIKG